MSAFPDVAALIGSRPAYDFTISYQDGKGSLKDTAFADDAAVSSGAAQAAAAMQRAGIIKEKDGNRFAPQDMATRAEAALLHRFVEVIIAPPTGPDGVRKEK